jgi:UDP-MurNAc hydroxylase
VVSSVQYLGHAGFIAQHRGIKILVDPWFYPAFLNSWFPYPDNRHLLSTIETERFDYLYVSHAHEDHYDERLLNKLNRSITVIVPKYRSQVMVRRFRSLGFQNIVGLGHKESYELGPGLLVTMYLDISHKETADCFLISMDSGFSILMTAIRQCRNCPKT